MVDIRNRHVEKRLRILCNLKGINAAEGPALHPETSLRGVGKPVLHLSQQRDQDRAAELLKAFITGQPNQGAERGGIAWFEEPGVGEFVTNILQQ